MAHELTDNVEISEVHPSPTSTSNEEELSTVQTPDSLTANPTDSTHVTTAEMSEDDSDDQYFTPDQLARRNRILAGRARLGALSTGSVRLSHIRSIRSKRLAQVTQTVYDGTPDAE